MDHPGSARDLGDSRSSLLSFEPGLVQLQRKSAPPVDRRAAEQHAGRTSTLSTGMNLVTVMVGCGVLGFPKVFGVAGWYVGPVILLASAFSGLEMGIATVEALVMCEERVEAGERYSFQRPEKYEDLFEVAYGRLGKDLASVTLNAFMLLVCGAFMILIGSSLQFLSDSLLPYRAWVLVMSVFFAGLCLLKDMQLISRLSMVGVLASLTYVVSIAQAGMEAGLSNRSKPGFAVRYFPDSSVDVGTVLSVMFMGFGYQLVTPTVRAEMAAPAEMPQAIQGSVSVVTFVYGAVGMVGYWGWGNDVSGNVLDSMVDADGERMFAGVVLSAAVIANLFVTLPILMNAVAVAAEGRCAGEYSPPLRLGLLTVAVVVGLFSPFFLQVLTLIGSTIGTIMLTFFPMMVYWKLVSLTGRHVPLLVYVKHGLVFLLGCVAMVFGTYDALADLHKAMQSPDANPFKNFWKPM